MCPGAQLLIFIVVFVIGTAILISAIDRIRFMIHNRNMKREESGYYDKKQQDNFYVEPKIKKDMFGEKDE